MGGISIIFLHVIFLPVGLVTLLTGIVFLLIRRTRKTCSRVTTFILSFFAYTLITLGAILTFLGISLIISLFSY